MKVLATGLESSGTRYVTDLLLDAGADALHRSQPEGVDWIDLAAMLDDFDAAVVVIRGHLAQIRSLQTCGISTDDADAADHRRRALRAIAPLLGDGRVIVVTYESLAHRAERRHLLAALKLDEDAADRCPWTDENPKHYWDYQ